MRKILALLLVFVVGDCVQVTRKLWWSGYNWTIIGIEGQKYTIQDEEMTIHGVPERMLRKCK